VTAICTPLTLAFCRAIWLASRHGCGPRHTWDLHDVLVVHVHAGHHVL
jgi:hypothetical protein